MHGGCATTLVCLASDREVKANFRYKVFTTGLHLFATLLVSHKIEKLRNAVGMTINEIHSYVSGSLETMQAVQRTSLMSRKARQCLSSFLEVFDTLSKSRAPSWIAFTYIPGQRRSKHLQQVR